MTKIPNAEGLELSGGEIGILLLHGFTSEFMPAWAHALHEAGFTVALPRLPAKAPRWEELSRAQWRDWYECAENEFRKLKNRSESVFLAGFGAGGALALRLAEIFGDEIDGVILLNLHYQFIAGFSLSSGAQLNSISISLINLFS